MGEWENGRMGELAMSRSLEGWNEERKAWRQGKQASGDRFVNDTVFRW